MATYDELLAANGDPVLGKKVMVAVVVAATSIMTEDPGVTNHPNRLIWAKEVFTNPAQAGARMMWPVLAQNKAAPIASITGADDATVQTAVNAAINVFAQG